MTNNSRKTMITAHSGCESTPPNSREHIMVAISSGADALEIDVRVDIYGKLYLSHDNSDENSTGCLSLKECFEMVYPHSPIIINCDVKQAGIAYSVLELARECGMSRRIIFTGELATDEGIEIQRTESAWWVNMQYTDDHDADYDLAVRKMQSAASPILNLNHKYVHAGMRAVTGGRLLSVWTADSEEDIKRLLELEVYNITTRKPVLALSMRAEYEVKKNKCR